MPVGEVGGMRSVAGWGGSFKDARGGAGKPRAVGRAGKPRAGVWIDCCTALHALQMHAAQHSDSTTHPPYL